MSDNGIYYKTVGDKSRGPVLNYFNLADENLTEIASLEKGTWPFELDVSSDQHWILYTQEAHHEVDIILVKNFR